MSKEVSKMEQYRQRLFHILELGPEEDSVGRAYDILNLTTIIINLVASILYTFEELCVPYGDTLLTVGYGHIYPISPIGQLLNLFITFLGVGMVAIPTGIISAGFVDRYSRIKRISATARP